jgi:acetyl esterase/lipase
MLINFPEGQRTVRLIFIQRIRTMWWATRVLRYLYLKITVTFLRTLFEFTRPAIIAKNPHTSIQIPSRDARRAIAAHLYTRDALPPSAPRPALINFHGSGFIFPAFGEDDEFCHYVRQNTDYTVIDVQYRLSPENPFPAAVHDVEDVVRWVLGQPDEFDLSRLSVSGFSAGGNLALAASCALLPPHTFRSALAFYPGTDLVKNPDEKIAPDTSGKVIPPRIARFFNNCYVPVGIDARDPRISPRYADPARFPPNLLIITAARDNLAPEAEELASIIQKQTDYRVVVRRMEDCEHGFDKRATPGTAHAEAKSTAYSMAVDMLKD